MRGIGADAAAARFRNEEAFDRHLHEIAGELVFQPGTAMWADFARNVDAIGVAAGRAHGVRHQVKRRFMHRAAGDGVQRAFVGVAVFLQPTLEQDDEAGLAAGRRAEQKQQAPPDLRPGSCGLEIVDHALDGLIDAEQLILEQAAAQAAFARVAAGAADHVPYILVRTARDLVRRRRQQRFHERREGAGPMPGPMLPGELVQAVDKIAMLIRLLRVRIVAR